jgi:predicted transcriptional regulator
MQLQLRSVMHPSSHERRPALPILKAPPKQPRNESLQLRVPTEFKHNLQHYAEFLDASPSYVVVEALNRIFEKDRDFKAWLEQHAEDTNEDEPENILSMETIRKA